MTARTLHAKMRRIKLAAGKAVRCARAAHRALHVAELAILMARSEGRFGLDTLAAHCTKAQDAATALDKYSTFLGESAASVVSDRRAESKLVKRTRARGRRIARRAT